MKFKKAIISTSELGTDGIKISDRVRKVSSLFEKLQTDLTPSHVAILGIILTSQIFDMLDNTRLGSGVKIQLTDALEICKKICTHR